MQLTVTYIQYNQSSSSQSSISSGSITEDLDLDSNSSISSVSIAPFSGASTSSSSRRISFGSASTGPVCQHQVVSGLLSLCWDLSKTVELSKLQLIERANWEGELRRQTTTRCKALQNKTKESGMYLVKQLELAQDLILRHDLTDTVGPKTLKTPRFVDYAHDLCCK